MIDSQINVGIDIGGTRIKAVAVRVDGEIVVERSVPSANSVDSLFKVVGMLVAELGTAKAAVGIGAPGIAARDNRSIAWMRGRMEAVEGLDWRQQLDHDIWVLNDAHAAAWAKHGSARLAARRMPWC